MQRTAIRVTLEGYRAKSFATNNRNNPTAVGMDSPNQLCALPSGMLTRIQPGI